MVKQSAFDTIITNNTNDGNSSWILTSSAMIMFMTFGLGLFYAGQLRAKNQVSTIGYIFIVYSVISIIWYFVGFSLTYGPAVELGGIIGNLDYAGMLNVKDGPQNLYAPTFPFTLFFFFELQFAAITGALILGGAVERVKLGPFIIFVIFWTVLVYAPIACWLWNTQGWLNNLGAIDFAGGCVVEINSGFSAVGISLVIGKRKSSPAHSKPSSIPMALLGVAILWFGWFGFNGGTANVAGALAVDAIISTNMAGATGGLFYILSELASTGKVTMMGFGIGAICGLVSITPSAGFIDPNFAFITGGVAGIICYFCIAWQKRTNYWDDPVDMWGCHGMGGVWGMIAAGLFGHNTIDPAIKNGIFWGGHFEIIGIQTLAIIVSATWSLVVSMFIMYGLKLMMGGVRVTEKEEEMGLDKGIHDEEAESKSLMEEKYDIYNANIYNSLIDDGYHPQEN